jgi:hypothetical protein
MLVKTYGSVGYRINVTTVTVETNINPGVNSFLVGLPDSVVKKSRQRIDAAKQKGMLVIGLTGKDGGKIAGLCDIEIRAPHSKYADRVQEIHIKIIHSLIHYVEMNL